MCYIYSSTNYQYSCMKSYHVAIWFLFVPSVLFLCSSFSAFLRINHVCFLFHFSHLLAFHSCMCRFLCIYCIYTYIPTYIRTCINSSTYILKFCALSLSTKMLTNTPPNRIYQQVNIVMHTRTKWGLFQECRWFSIRKST